MTRRTRLTIVIIIVLIALLIAGWILMSMRAPSGSNQPSDSSQEEVIEETKPVIQKTESDEELAQVTRERRQMADLNATAKTFVERYGSYSNEAEFQNLIDVFPLMTASFVETTQGFIDSSTLPEEYYGVTTKVITVNSESLDEEAGTATLLLTTQKEEASGSVGNVNVRYQDIRLDMLKQGGVWKVNLASWL